MNNAVIFFTQNSGNPVKPVRKKRYEFKYIVRWVGKVFFQIF